MTESLRASFKKLLADFVDYEAFAEHEKLLRLELQNSIRNKLESNVRMIQALNNDVKICAQARIRERITVWNRVFRYHKFAERHYRRCFDDEAVVKLSAKL